MSTAIEHAASWPTLLIAILVYGFAPGFLLRLFVLMYRKDDPRRQELIAELYAISRWKRPFWVAEQLETALFDGAGPRLSSNMVSSRVFLARHRTMVYVAISTVTGIPSANILARLGWPNWIQALIALGLVFLNVAVTLSICDTTPRTPRRRLGRGRR